MQILRNSIFWQFRSSLFILELENQIKTMIQLQKAVFDLDFAMARRANRCISAMFAKSNFGAVAIGLRQPDFFRGWRFYFLFFLRIRTLTIKMKVTVVCRIIWSILRLQRMIYLKQENSERVIFTFVEKYNFLFDIFSRVHALNSFYHYEKRIQRVILLPNDVTGCYIHKKNEMVC